MKIPQELRAQLLGNYRDVREITPYTCEIIKPDVLRTQRGAQNRVIARRLSKLLGVEVSSQSMVRLDHQDDLPAEIKKHLLKNFCLSHVGAQLGINERAQQKAELQEGYICMRLQKLLGQKEAAIPAIVIPFEQPVQSNIEAFSQVG